MITNKNEAKAMTKHISCDYKCKFNSKICNQVKKQTIKHQCECKNDYSWNPSTCICENSSYLKSTSMTECNEIMSVMDIVSTKKTNIMSTVSINCHNIKIRDCYILHTVLLAIILLLIAIIFCYHYSKKRYHMTFHIKL